MIFKMILLYLLCFTVLADTRDQPDTDLCEGTFHSRPRGEKDGVVLNKCKFALSPSASHDFDQH